jgi:hypothetical protein
MKIRPVGAELFHADGQTDRHDKLVVAFRNFAKAAEKQCYEAMLTHDVSHCNPQM